MARPKEYAREDALNSAMLLFWEKGYERTSMQELTQAMKISRSSIYEEFESKEALFLEVLALYAQQKKHKREVLIQKSLKPKQALLALFDQLIDGLHEDALPDGCLLTETAANLESVNSSISHFIKQQIDGIYDSYLSLIVQVREQEGLKTELSDETLAYMLLNFHEGVIILSGLNHDLSLQKQTIEHFLDMI